MTWRGIPHFMHKRDNDDATEDIMYNCGEPFRSWSTKWMNSYSDICEIEGERVFRFTSGREVKHLPLCPTCWVDDVYEIPPPQPTAFNEVEFQGEHGYEISTTIKSEESPLPLPGLYLWDSL